MLGKVIYPACLGLVHDSAVPPRRLTARLPPGFTIHTEAWSPAVLASSLLIAWPSLLTVQGRRGRDREGRSVFGGRAVIVRLDLPFLQQLINHRSTRF